MILRVGSRFLNLAQVADAFDDPEGGELIVSLVGDSEGRLRFHGEEAARLRELLDLYSEATERSLRAMAGAPE